MWCEKTKSTASLLALRSHLHRRVRTVSCTTGDAASPPSPPHVSPSPITSHLLLRFIRSSGTSTTPLHPCWHSYRFPFHHPDFFSPSFSRSTSQRLIRYRRSKQYCCIPTRKWKSRTLRSCWDCDSVREHAVSGPMQKQYKFRGFCVSEEEQQHIIFLCFLFMLVPALSASYQNQREQQYSSAFGLNRLAQQPIRNPKFPQKKASLETASNKLGTKHTTIFSFFHPVCKLCLETSNLVWGAWIWRRNEGQHQPNQHVWGRGLKWKWYIVNISLTVNQVYFNAR